MFLLVFGFVVMGFCCWYKVFFLGIWYFEVVLLGGWVSWCFPGFGDFGLISGC